MPGVSPFTTRLSSALLEPATPLVCYPPQIAWRHCPLRHRHRGFCRIQWSIYVSWRLGGKRLRPAQFSSTLPPWLALLLPPRTATGKQSSELLHQVRLTRPAGRNLLPCCLIPRLASWIVQLPSLLITTALTSLGVRQMPVCGCCLPSPSAALRWSAATQRPLVLIQPILIIPILVVIEPRLQSFPDQPYLHHCFPTNMNHQGFICLG